MSKCDKAKKCMCSAKKNTIKFFRSDWSMKDKSMVVAIALMAGIIVGFLVSPVKGGVFSNNKFGCGNTADDFEDEEIDDIDL